MAVLVTGLTTGAVLVPSTATADVNSAQASVAQLQQRLAADGVKIQQLVEQYDQALAQQQVATQHVQQAEAHLAADQQAENKAMAVLRSIALSTYLSDAQDSSNLAIFSSGDATSIVAQQEYTHIANTGLRNAVDTVTIDARNTAASEVALKAAQQQAQALVSQLAAAQAAAQAAMNQDDALLASAKSNLAAALAQQQAAQLAAERAREAALAAAQAAAQTAAAHPPPVNFHPSPGSYANPLRSVNGLNPERIDQGVDYSGYGPVYAVGDGTVISTTNGGWPGGTFIAYKLTDGPAAGLVAYAAEDLEPTVSVGQTVTAATVIGTMYEGPDGMETGWADPSGDGMTMARDYGQFNGNNSTAFGANFSRMLASLGAPPGVLETNPPTGNLPPNWPTW
ncbi:MAG: hypothetical protein KGJ77_01015 [Acidobacteriota bacterium]|nr:hypothetical protein [Acidobacteriota bacterium]